MFGSHVPRPTGKNDLILWIMQLKGAQICKPQESTGLTMTRRDEEERWHAMLPQNRSCHVRVIPKAVVKCKNHSNLVQGPAPRVDFRVLNDLEVPRNEADVPLENESIETGAISRHAMKHQDYRFPWSDGSRESDTADRRG
jgi:hypothetical protein